MCRGMAQRQRPPIRKQQRSLSRRPTPTPALTPRQLGALHDVPVFARRQASPWKAFDAVRACPKNAVKKHVDAGAEIVGARWVLTRKTNGALKARLVVQGC